VGRADSNSLVIAQDTVSAEHALVEFRNGTFFLRDLRSANGTFLNGRRFSDTEAIRETALKHGDRIRFDAYEFEFVVHELLDVPELAPEGGETAGVHRTVVRSSAPGDLARGPGALRPEPGPAGAGDQRGREAQTIVKPEKCPNHPWNATELCPLCRRAVCQHCLVQTGDGTLCVDCARDARGRTGTTE
jgi:pSer/pThr/pTyr-binding forkhead associated (FHA) protein